LVTGSCFGERFHTEPADIFIRGPKLDGTNQPAAYDILKIGRLGKHRTCARVQDGS
jgi:hypothetical protein